MFPWRYNRNYKVNKVFSDTMRQRKHYIYLCAAMLFWQNRSARIRDGKKATKLAQIAASPIQRREHEGKWTRFHLLPDLCPLCRSCCHEKSVTSVGSPLPTQFEWVNVCCSDCCRLCGLGVKVNLLACSRSVKHVFILRVFMCHLWVEGST